MELCSEVNAVSEGQAIIGHFFIWCCFGAWVVLGSELEELVLTEDAAVFYKKLQNKTQRVWAQRIINS